MSTNDYDGDGPSWNSDGVTVQIDDTADRSELTAYLEQLAEENEQLRTVNKQLRNDTRTDQPRHRRLGRGLAFLGILSGLSVFVFPGARNILLAMAATGLFGGVLTYYLSGDQFLSATVCNAIYTAGAANGSAIVDELELQDDRVYLPDGDGGARLFIPQESSYEFPNALDGLFVTADQQGRSVAADQQGGVVLEPTGGALFEAFKRTASSDLPDTPSELTLQLADAIVEQFELARNVEASISSTDDGERVTVTVTDSTIGTVDRFDHPITSFFAVGFAVGLNRPIEFEGASPDDRSEWEASYHWTESDVGA